MKPERKTRVAVIGCAIVLTLLLFASAAVADEAVRTTSVSLDRGQSYVIRGLEAGTRPEVRTVDNPKALVVEVQPDGTVAVLGADAGQEIVRVTGNDGHLQDYKFTVRAVSGPHSPLAPGVAPEAGAAPRDTGAGPVAHAEPPRAESTPAAVVGASSATTSARSSGTESEVYPAEPPSASAAPVTPGAGAAEGAGAPPESAPSARPVTKSQGAAPVFANNPPAAAPAPGVVAHGPDTLPDDAITMRFGTSRIFDFARRVKRVSIADSETADVQVIDPHQVMLIGKKPGFTTLAVWDTQGHYEERQVRVEQTGPQQVMLNALVAEVDRSQLENQGVDYTAALSRYGLSIVGLPGAVAAPYTPSTVLSQTSSATTGGLLPNGGSIIPLILSNDLVYGITGQNSNVQAQAFFRFLETHSLAKVLAQPRLVANSGEEAKFLSGGEIPIVIAQALNTSIVFKQFGTSVVFVPTVIGKREIELVVKPEVSKPDFTQGVSLFGFVVPAFIEQKAETVVRMNEGQTLIIAGLILSDRKSIVQKIPYLGDVPWLGGLFRNTTYQNQKTELVMTVTPRIVAPIPAYAQAAYPNRPPLTREEISTAPVEPPDASRQRLR